MVQPSEQRKQPQGRWADRRGRRWWWWWDSLHGQEGRQVKIREITVMLKTKSLDKKKKRERKIKREE